MRFFGSKHYFVALYEEQRQPHQDYKRNDVGASQKRNSNVYRTSFVERCRSFASHGPGNTMPNGHLEAARIGSIKRADIEQCLQYSTE
jgi:hypothetical protein